MSEFTHFLEAVDRRAKYELAFKRRIQTHASLLMKDAGEIYDMKDSVYTSRINRVVVGFYTVEWCPILPIGMNVTITQKNHFRLELYAEENSEVLVDADGKIWGNVDFIEGELEFPTIRRGLIYVSYFWDNRITLTGSGLRHRQSAPEDICAKTYRM